MRRTRGRDVAVVVGALVVVIVLLVVVLGGGDDRAGTPVRQVPPTPVVVGGGERGAAPAELSPAERGAARRAAFVFARSYIPVLYGRAEPAQLVGATRHLRRSLREAERPPAGVRRRHAQLRGVELTVQSARSVVASATVRDGVTAPFRVVFTVELRDGRWVVSDLASD